MLDNSIRSKINEKVVLEIRDSIIESSLDNGFSVIVDDTNLNPIHERDLKLLAAKC
jgi:predicted kinase